MPKSKTSPKAKKVDYFKMQAVGEDSAKINLYGYVGGWDTDAYYFKQKLEELGAVKEIDLHIHSEGGSVFEGVAIYNLLDSHPAIINVYIDGIAMSMASYIAMVGDTINTPENAIWMVHNPQWGAQGEAKDMRKTADALDVVKEAMIGAYVKRTGLSREEISDIMDAETWLTGADAVALGFGTELIGEVNEDMAACFTASAIEKIPEEFRKNLNLSAVAGIPLKKEAVMPKAVKAAATPEAANVENAVTDPVAVVDPQAIAAQALAAESTRQTDIRAAFNGFDGEHRTLMDACLTDQKTTVADAQAKLLKALGNNETPAATNQTWNVTGKAPEAKRMEGMGEALAMRSGLVAHDLSNPFRSLTMMEMAKDILQMQGVSTLGMGKLDVVAAAFTHSSGDFGSLLSGTANKAMLKGYDEAEEVFQLFTSKGTLTDFKINERVDLGTFPSLRQVRAGAEYKSVTLEDRGVQVQLATYGEKFGITRQAIINDDLGAFTKIPQKMGRAAVRTVGDLVFAILNSNPKMGDNKALFHADHKNLGTGIVSTAVVDSMRTMMTTQKDGKASLNINPAFWLVPTTMRGLASQIMKSEYEIAASKDATAYNYVRDTLEVVSDARLTGTANYQLANPNIHDTIEVSYLDGVETPFLEQQSGWNIDGVEYKVRLDATVDALDYKTMTKNTGI